LVELGHFYFGLTGRRFIIVWWEAVCYNKNIEAMLKFLQDWQKKNQEKRLLLQFRAEIDKNLEQYYVMFQINRLRFFKMDCWEQVRRQTGLFLDGKIGEYTESLSAYNAALREFKEFESWYTGDSSRKTRDNGIKLHDKKKNAQQRFSGLETAIKGAQSALKEYLRKAGIEKR